MNTLYLDWFVLIFTYGAMVACGVFLVLSAWCIYRTARNNMKSADYHADDIDEMTRQAKHKLMEDRAHEM